ncbi:MAG: phosphatidate cytidylyltransferase [Pseudomonadota bacterium]
MSNLAKRFATAGVAIPLLILFIFILPKWTILIPVAVCIFAGSFEVMTMIGQSRSRVQYSAGSAIILLFCYAMFSFPRDGLIDAHLGIVQLAFTGAALCLTGIIFYKPVETAGRRLAGLFTALFYPGILLTVLAVIHNRLEHGPRWVLCILMTAFLCDTGAYFAGRAFGKHKLAPNLSPKKTIEGVAGGIAGSLAATMSAHFIFLPQITLQDAVILGVGGSLSGVVGDLIESLIKRSSGIKDAGKFFPGHGGMMDRIDGLLIVIPFFYFYIYFRFSPGF